jgi:peptidoglycan/LPS O-acetylase OafA/YrhL
LNKELLINFFKGKWLVVLFSSIVFLFFLISIPNLQGDYYFINQSLKIIHITLFSHSGLIVNVLIGLLLLFLIKDNKKYFLFNLSPIVFIGKISYGLYLWQQFFTYSHGNWYSNLYFNILFILLFTLVSYYFVEKPILKFKKYFY